MASVEFEVELLRDEVKGLRRELDGIHARAVTRSIRALQCVVALYVVALPLAAVLLRG